MIKSIFLLSLIYLLPAKEVLSQNKNEAKLNTVIYYGGIIRGDTTIKKIALVFTGNEFADGGNYIAKVLKEQMSILNTICKGRMNHYR